MQTGDSEFIGARDTRLVRRWWLPDGTPRAVIVLVHGLRDHSARYDALARALVEADIAVHAFDLRGHGKSAGDRVWVETFDDYVDDVERFLKLVSTQVSGKPLFLFGHSMGGAIATLTTLTRKPALAGLVLSAPALKPGDEVSPFLISVTGFLSRILPRLPVLKLPDAAFSRVPAAVADMVADPLIENGSGPARTASELLGALGRIGASMETLSTPVLLLHGTADKLTNPEGSKALHARAASTDKTLRLFDGWFHDLLHEPEAALVITEIVDWVEARA